MKKNSRDIYLQRLELALRFIEQHLDENLNLETVATTAHFSPFHFHRLFHSLSGETPNNLVNRLRLERAANRLLFQPRTAITQIALESGFKSHSSFTNAFKKHFQLSPSQWRKQKSKIAQVPGPPIADNTHNMNTSTPSFTVEIKRLEEKHMAYVSSRSGYQPDQLGQTWNRLLSWAQSKNMVSPQSEFLSLAMDNPDITQAYQCRYFAGIRVRDPNVIQEKNIGYMQLPAGDYAVLRFHHHPEFYPHAYSYLYERWLLQSAYQAADSPCYEHLYDLHPDAQGRIRADICLPINAL